MADEAELARVLMEGARLWNAHRFFECHDKLEEAWRALKNEKKAEPPRDPRRDFVHGIILYAAAYVHWQRGNPLGIERKLADARNVLGPHVPARSWGISMRAWGGLVEAHLEEGIRGAALDLARVPRLEPSSAAAEP